MSNDFELPIHYKGKDLVFPGQLHLYTYTQKIEILVETVPVFFERDDEGAWRALITPEEVVKTKSMDTGLLKAIAEAIEEVLR